MSLERKSAMNGTNVTILLSEGLGKATKLSEIKKNQNIIWIVSCDRRLLWYQLTSTEFKL